MDNTVLLEKRKNLLFSSASTKELFLNSYFIDLLPIINHEEIVPFFENPSINEIRINKEKIIANVSEMINVSSDETSLKKILQTLRTNIDDVSSSKEKLIKKITEEKIAILDKLLEFSLLSKIEYYDTSIWTLHISYGTLEGVIKYINHDDLCVRSPLINVPIEITRSDNGEYVIKKMDDIIYGNETLGIFLDEQLEKQTNISSTINTQNVFSINEYLNTFTTLFPTLNIETDLSSFNKTTKDVINKSETLSIKRNCFIALINPIGGKMLRDYDAILKKEYRFPTYDTIFHKDLNHLIYEQDEIYEINNPLNLIQKLAVSNAQNKNMLIYGPPGTGKSEVVANLIANLVLADKNVIVVSEKKAALDVLDNRMLSINTICMNVFDETNSASFYEKIIQLNHLILSTNKIQPKFNNESYLQLLKYQSLINNLTNYVDINKKDIYEFLANYDAIDFIEYQKQIDTIKFISNKLMVDKIDLETLLQKVNILHEIQTYANSIFTNETINHDAMHFERAQEFLKTLEQVPEKDQGFIIVKFLIDNEILSKKPLFQSRAKLAEKIDVNKVKELLQKIINDKLIYIVNHQKIYTFLTNNKQAAFYISLYDWLTNTNFQQYIDLIKNNKISQILIRQYWNDRKSSTQGMDEIIRDHFINNLKEKLLNNREDEKKWTELVRVANLTKKPNINKVINEYYSILRIAFPIWILSPDKTITIIPLKENEFDYGIFDEASQMRMERSLPLIYRCQFAIVSGDDKQLKPSSFFSKTTNLDETYDGDLDNVDSLLDKAKTSNWMSFTLSNHYRSLNEQLIRFSSHYFYNDDLICITKNDYFKKCIDVFNEMGIYDRENGINEKEANKTIQCLLNAISLYKNIIVITFNSKQAEFIQHLALSHSELATKIENLSLKIRSLENVQGDEGDLVIISCTFGKDKNDKFLQNFGPINQSGGKNRINVMVSRAKEKMIIIKSFMSSDITNESNENTSIFRKFIHYAEEIENSKQTIDNSNEQIQTQDFSRALEVLSSQLTLDSSLVVQQNKKIGSHIIDLCVSKANNSKVSLCIFIDGKQKNTKYAQDSKNWIKNIDLQKYYEDRGYLSFRVNTLELLTNTNGVVNLIRQQIV